MKALSTSFFTVLPVRKCSVLIKLPSLHFSGYHSIYHAVHLFYVWPKKRSKNNLITQVKKLIWMDPKFKQTVHPATHIKTNKTILKYVVILAVEARSQLTPPMPMCRGNHFKENDSCMVEWALETTLTGIPEGQAHYLHATEGWYCTVFIWWRPLIWCNHGKAARDRRPTKTKKVQCNTEEVRQVLNNSLLICNNKIIWSVKYVPVSSPTGNVPPILPHCCMLRVGMKNIIIFVQNKQCSASENEVCVGFFSFCSTGNLGVYNKTSGHMGEISLYGYEKHSVLPKHF